MCSRFDVFLANSFEFYAISESPGHVQDVMAGGVANHQQVFCCRDDEPQSINNWLHLNNHLLSVICSQSDWRQHG